MAPRRLQVEKAGEAGRAGDVGRGPGGAGGELVGGQQLRLLHDEGATPGREHRLDDRQPVVRLVVEDPVRGAPGLGLPRPHVGRAVVGGAIERGTYAGPCDVHRSPRRCEVTVEIGGQAVIGAEQWPAAGGLDRVDPGHRRQDAERTRLGQALRTGRGEGAAPDLDDHPVQGHAFARDRLRHLEGQRFAALDRESVERALARERDRPVLDGRKQSAHGRVAMAARRPPDELDPRMEALEPGQDGRVGVGRDEDVEPTPRGMRDDGRSQGGVPTARDGQRPALERGVEGLPDEQLEHDAHQVAGLVRAGHAPRLVLDPDAVIRAGSQDGAQGIRSLERCDAEPVAVHGRHGPVQPMDETDVALVRPPGCPSDVPGTEHLAIADERVGVVVRRQRRRARGRSGAS